NAEDISGGGVNVGGTPSAPRNVVSGVHARGQSGSHPGPAPMPVQGSDHTGPSIVAAMAQQQQTPSAAKYVLAAAIGITVVAGLGAVGIIVARNRAMADDTPAVTATTKMVAPPTTSASSAPEKTAPV